MLKRRWYPAFNRVIELPKSECHHIPDMHTHTHTHTHRAAIVGPKLPELSLAYVSPCLPGPCSWNFSGPEGSLDSPTASNSPPDVGLDCFYYISVYPGYGVEIKVSGLDLAEEKLGSVSYLSRKVLVTWGRWGCARSSVGEGA